MGRVVFVPAPTGGLNARDPVLLMPETDAQTLDNMVCEPGYVRNKGGDEIFCQVANAYTLQSVKLEDGAEKFLAICFGNTFQQIDTGTAVDRTTTYNATAAMTSPQWRTCVYRHRIFGCNGVDRPFVWTGSGDVTVAGWTGPTNSSKQLSSVNPYRSRLYFCERASASIWYTASVDNVTGALVEVPLDSLLHLGGFPIFAGSTSNRQGDSSQELFAIYTTEGEVLIYSGRYPADSSWQIIGRYQIAKPYSGSLYDAQGGVYVNDELYLMTELGPVSIRELLGGISQNDLQLESGKVRPMFIAGRNSLTSYTTTFSAANVQRKNYVVFILNDGYQLVMNTISKAWSKWASQSYIAIGMFNNKLYGSTTISGTNYVVEIDAAFGNDTSIPSWKIKHAYSFLDNPQANKKVTLMQPLITVEKSSGSEATDTMTYGVDSDLESPTALNDMSFQVTSSTAKLNKPVMPLTAYGKALALRLEDAPSTGYDVRYYGSWVQVEDAGGLT